MPAVSTAPPAAVNCGRQQAHRRLQPHRILRRSPTAIHGSSGVLIDRTFVTGPMRSGDDDGAADSSPATPASTRPPIMVTRSAIGSARKTRARTTTTTMSTTTTTSSTRSVVASPDPPVRPGSSASPAWPTLSSRPPRGLSPGYSPMTDQMKPMKMKIPAKSPTSAGTPTVSTSSQARQQANRRDQAMMRSRNR